MARHLAVLGLLPLILLFVINTSAAALRLHSSAGDVDFNHEEHKMFVKCQVCHHKKQEGCYSCHPKSNPFARAKIFHLLCRSCHKQEKAGPTDCTECHQPCSHIDERLGE